MTDTDIEIQRLIKAGCDAYRAGQHRQMERLFRAAIDRAQMLGPVAARQRVEAQFWLGVALNDLGKPEAALVELLTAARCPDPAADPADQYNALTKAIDISNNREPVIRIRALLNDCRHRLIQWRREEWDHRLDYLESELAIARGDFSSADRLARRAWSRWRVTYPSFTAGTHLRTLCAIAFSQRDNASLAEWVRVREGHRYEHEGDRIYHDLSRTLLCRAEGKGGDASAVDTARQGLTRCDSTDENDDIERATLCYPLALAGLWTELDRQFDRHPLTTELEGLIFRGDERLCRARAVLGLPVRDDEWDTEFPLPATLAGDHAAAGHWLEEAARFFTAAHTKAAEKDTRLDTCYWTTLVEGRQARLADLQAKLR